MRENAIDRAVNDFRKEKERKRELEHERKLAEIRSGGADKAITWTGTKFEFADWILSAYDKGSLSAASKTEALTNACPHFCGKDGKKMDPRSLLQNYSHKTQSNRS
jgi:hypothetical protein